jgi:hypothetical protein
MSEPSPRARRIVAELTDSLPRLLGTGLEALLLELDAEYARRIAQAGQGAARDGWVEARRRLAEGRAVFSAAFFEGLRRESLALLDPRAPQPAPLDGAAPPAQRRLALVDEEVLDEEGALGAIATRHEHRASLSLLLLGQRFGVLLGRPPQDAAARPVGPQAFGRALAGAARRTGLALEARIALYGVYDRGFMRQYPEFAEAMDTQVDRSGVLPGLAFVPLRPRDVPGHAGRGVAPTGGATAPGEAGAGGAAPASANAEAVRIVNEAVAQLRQVGRVPESLATERRETIAAMTRYLLRHGPGSPEWKACVDTARSVLEAASRRERPPPEARAWIEGALRSVGYGGDDARRLAEGLTSMDGAPSSLVPVSGNTRSAREQRCRERLATLSIGTQIGFSSRQGLVRARLRYFYPEPGLLLLATEGDGQEALYEIDVVARQMAEGQAWVIRNRPAETAALPAAAAEDADRRTVHRGGDA